MLSQHSIIPEEATGLDLPKLPSSGELKNTIAGIAEHHFQRLVEETHPHSRFERLIRSAQQMRQVGLPTEGVRQELISSFTDDMHRSGELHENKLLRANALAKALCCGVFTKEDVLNFESDLLRTFEQGIAYSDYHAPDSIINRTIFIACVGNIKGESFLDTMSCYLESTQTFEEKQRTATACIVVGVYLGCPINEIASTIRDHILSPKERALLEMILCLKHLEKGAESGDVEELLSPVRIIRESFSTDDPSTFIPFVLISCRLGEILHLRLHDGRGEYFPLRNLVSNMPASEGKKCLAKVVYYSMCRSDLQGDADKFYDSLGYDRAELASMTDSSVEWTQSAKQGDPPFYKTRMRVSEVSPGDWQMLDRLLFSDTSSPLDQRIETEFERLQSDRYYSLCDEASCEILRIIAHYTSRDEIAETIKAFQEEKFNELDVDERQRSLTTIKPDGEVTSHAIRVFDLSMGSLMRLGYVEEALRYFESSETLSTEKLRYAGTTRSQVGELIIEYLLSEPNEDGTVRYMTRVITQLEKSLASYQQYQRNRVYKDDYEASYGQDDQYQLDKCDATLGKMYESLFAFLCEKKEARQDDSFVFTPSYSDVMGTLEDYKKWLGLSISQETVSS